MGELLSILEEVLTACCALGKIYCPIYQLLSAFLYWKCQAWWVKESEYFISPLRESGGEDCMEKSLYDDLPIEGES